MITGDGLAAVQRKDIANEQIFPAVTSTDFKSPPVSTPVKPGQPSINLIP